MSRKQRGALIIIGGSEDKKGERIILKEVAELTTAASGKLVIFTIATRLPEEVGEEYRSIFRDLGVRHLDVLDIRNREEVHDEANVKKLVGAAAIFFTGGDQLRITSQLGNSPVCKMMHEVHEQGGAIIGTSAGAAAMPDTMMLSGGGEESPGESELIMAAGLGFVSDVTIDSHFTQRGRIGRLLAAVTQNPMNLGLGIDEDTAIVHRGSGFRVIGSGAVYAIDGTDITYSSLSEKHTSGIITIHDVKLHVLGSEQRFDLRSRRPVAPATAKQS